MSAVTNQYKIKSICRGSWTKDLGEYSVITESGKDTLIKDPDGNTVFTTKISDPVSAVQYFLSYKYPFDKRPHLNSGRVVQFFNLDDSTDYTFTIVPTPSDASVIINEVARTSLTADKGTVITWEVSKEHYLTQTGSYTLNQTHVENVALVLEQHTFTIVPTPDDATVLINGEERTSLTADYGTEISWSVAKEGYNSQSGTYTLNDNHTENVTLVAKVQYYAWKDSSENIVYTIDDVPTTESKVYTYIDSTMTESSDTVVSYNVETSKLTVSVSGIETEFDRDSADDLEI